MVSKDEIRQHQPGAPLWLRIMMTIIFGLLAGFATWQEHSGRLAIIVGSATFLVVFPLGMPLRKAARQKYRQFNTMGYDLVWFINKSNELDNRLEPRDRRNALKNESRYALYQKLGGRGGPKFRLGKREADDPYPTWVGSLRVRGTSQDQVVRIVDQFGSTVEISIAGLLRLVNRLNYHCISIWLTGLRENAEALEERLGQLDKTLSATEKKLGDATVQAKNLRLMLDRLVYGGLVSILNFLESTSRLRHTKEGKELLDQLTELQRKADVELSSIRSSIR